MVITIIVVAWLFSGSYTSNNVKFTVYIIYRYSMYEPGETAKKKNGIFSQEK